MLFTFLSILNYLSNSKFNNTIATTFKTYFIMRHGNRFITDEKLHLFKLEMKMALNSACPFRKIKGKAGKVWMPN